MTTSGKEMESDKLKTTEDIPKKVELKVEIESFDQPSTSGIEPRPTTSASHFAGKALGSDPARAVPTAPLILCEGPDISVTKAEGTMDSKAKHSIIPPVLSMPGTPTRCTSSPRPYSRPGSPRSARSPRPGSRPHSPRPGTPPPTHVNPRRESISNPLPSPSRQYDSCRSPAKLSCTLEDSNLEAEEAKGDSEMVTRPISPYASITQSPRKSLEYKKSPLRSPCKTMKIVEEDEPAEGLLTVSDETDRFSTSPDTSPLRQMLKKIILFRPSSPFDPMTSPLPDIADEDEDSEKHCEREDLLEEEDELEEECELTEEPAGSTQSPVKRMLKRVIVYRPASPLDPMTSPLPELSDDDEYSEEEFHPVGMQMGGMKELSEAASGSLSSSPYSRPVRRKLIKVTTTRDDVLSSLLRKIIDVDEHCEALCQPPDVQTAKVESTEEDQVLGPVKSGGCINSSLKPRPSKRVLKRVSIQRFTDPLDIVTTDEECEGHSQSSNMQPEPLGSSSNVAGPNSVYSTPTKMRPKSPCLLQVPTESPRRALSPSTSGPTKTPSDNPQPSTSRDESQDTSEIICGLSRQKAKQSRKPRFKDMFFEPQRPNTPPSPPAPFANPGDDEDEKAAQTLKKTNQSFFGKFVRKKDAIHECPHFHHTAAEIASARPRNVKMLNRFTRDSRECMKQCPNLTKFLDRYENFILKMYRAGRYKMKMEKDFSLGPGYRLTADCLDQEDCCLKVTFEKSFGDYEHYLTEFANFQGFKGYAIRGNESFLIYSRETSALKAKRHLDGVVMLLEHTMSVEHVTAYEIVKTLTGRTPQELHRRNVTRDAFMNVFVNPIISPIYRGTIADSYRHPERRGGARRRGDERLAPRRQGDRAPTILLETEF